MHEVVDSFRFKMKANIFLSNQPSFFDIHKKNVYMKTFMLDSLQKQESYNTDTCTTNIKLSTDISCLFLVLFTCEETYKLTT